ncbi:MAG: acpP [Candidatus Berkelbacteria bacterium]|nr:acpP [Candidatus Berkelbacteria bacterium]
MDRQEIETIVKDVVANQLGVNRGDLRLTSRLTDDLKADSLGLVELLMAFEDVFQIGDINEEAADKMKTVGDIIDHVAQVKGTT